MDRVLRGRFSSVLALIAASAVMPAAAVHFLARDGQAPFSGPFHLILVAVAAGIAGGASVGMIIAGARRGDGRTVIVGGAFAAMAAVLIVHGLATPGVLVGDNGLVALAGGAALPVGGALLSLSTFPALRRPRRIGALVAVLAAVVALLVLGGIAALLDPALYPAPPATGSPLALTVLALGLLFFAVLAARAARTFALTRRPADLAVVVGTVWLGAALVPTLTLGAWSWGWWGGHVFELAGIALVAWPVGADIRRGAPSRPLAGDLRAGELVAAEEAFLGGQVRALMARLAEKDAYTEGHTRRVALRAVQVGEALGLPAGRLRELAIGGMLHDMGKLATPDAVLQKPGALDDAEFAIIRRHPDQGDELLAELGFGHRVRRMVRDHHERLDGSGYPRGLTGAEMALETRVLAVCDVYDALVSARVYRPAWPAHRAVALLREEAGTKMDARCVAALERVLDAEAAPLAAAA